MYNVIEAIIFGCAGGLIGGLIAVVIAQYLESDSMGNQNGR